MDKANVLMISHRPPSWPSTNDYQNHHHHHHHHPHLSQPYGKNHLQTLWNTTDTHLGTLRIAQDIGDGPKATTPQTTWVSCNRMMGSWLPILSAPFISSEDPTKTLKIPPVFGGQSWWLRIPCEALPKPFPGTSKSTTMEFTRWVPVDNSQHASCFAHLRSMKQLMNIRHPSRKIITSWWFQPLSTY